MSSNPKDTDSSSPFLQKLVTIPLLCDVLEREMHKEAETQSITMNYNKHTSQTHSYAQQRFNESGSASNNSNESNDQKQNQERQYRRNSLPSRQRSHSERASRTYHFDYQQGNIQSLMNPPRNNLARNNSVHLNRFKYVANDNLNTKNYSPKTSVISHLELESRHIEQTNMEDEAKRLNPRLSLEHSKTNVPAAKSEQRYFPKAALNSMESNTSRRSSAPVYLEIEEHNEWKSETDSVFIPTTENHLDNPHDRVKHGLKRRHFSETTTGLSERSHGNKKLRLTGGPQPLLQREGSRRSTSPRPVELPFTLDTLTEEIKVTSKNCTQSSDLLAKKQTLCTVLENIFKRQFPGCSLHLVGSSVNGFGNQSSDADLCLMLTHWREIDQRFEARKILLRLDEVLKRCHFVEDSQVIFATVPIIKFVDSVSKCECDININNHVGIRNTFLLKAYCLTDERVCPLVMVVKKWAKTHGINDAKDGTLSSYALALMVIHYLQCGCSPPVLQSLQNLYPDLFRDDGNVTDLLKLDVQNLLQQKKIAKTQNKDSLGYLLLGFFRYFSSVFRWDSTIISVRLGRSYSIAIGKMKKKYIHIEEPFDSNNVAKTVYDVANFNKIKMKISLAANKLKVSPSLKSIL